MFLGCAPNDGVHQALEGIEWELQVVEAADGTVRPAQGHPVRLTFTGEVADGTEGMSRLQGSGGCNRFFGGYALDGAGGLTVTELGATRMMCPDSVMAAEDAFLESLPRATSYLISGLELAIEIDGGWLLLAASQP
jgi:heat shock protein HslJ